MLIFQDNGTNVPVDYLLPILSSIKHPVGFSTITFDLLTTAFYQAVKSAGYYVQASIPYAEGRAMEMVNDGVNMLLTNGNLDSPIGTLTDSYNSDAGFVGIEHTGTVMVNGFSLANGQTITLPVINSFLGAVELKILMEGKVKTAIPLAYEGTLQVVENGALRLNYITYDVTNVIITSIGTTLIRYLDEALQIIINLSEINY